MSFEHLFVELALFCRLSTFWKWVSVTFSDVFFTTQIIPDLIFSIWQAYILLSRKII